MYRILCLSLFVFLFGIVLGGVLIALLPHPNHIHLSVMPYQSVNLSPEVGDVIDWSTYGQSTPPTVTFSQFTGSPCRDKSPGSSCVYDVADNGIYIYQCSGSATCDPGMGPSSGTHSGAGSGIVLPVLRAIGRFLQNVAISIDQTLGFITESGTPVTPPPAVPLGLAAAVRPLDAASPDAQVGCINQRTSINNPSITKPVGQFISWVGSTSFTIAVDQSICQGDMSKAAPVQSCQVIKTAAATLYTINDTSCTSQPELNTPTITAISAASATR